MKTLIVIFNGKSLVLQGDSAKAFYEKVKSIKHFCNELSNLDWFGKYHYQ